MSDKTVSYSVLKGLDIESAMKASSKSTSASRTVEKSDSTVWDQTVATIMSNADLSALVRATDKEAISALRQAMCDTMANVITSSITMPETGPDREGKTITLKKPDGTYKWASWSETRRIFAYIGDIAKIVMFGKESELYPEALKVGARCDVLALCVEEKPAIKKVKDAAKNLQAALDLIETAQDAQESLTTVSALRVNNLDIQLELHGIIGRLDALLAVSEDADKQAIRSRLLNVAVKHFEDK